MLQFLKCFVIAWLIVFLALSGVMWFIGVPLFFLWPVELLLSAMAGLYFAAQWNVVPPNPHDQHRIH